MSIAVRLEAATALPAYARVSIAFEVQSVLDVRRAEGETGTFELSERPIEARYVKDYDAHGEGPLQWAAAFDLSRWSFFSARIGDEWVGAATVVFDAPGVRMLEGRRDLAILWDIRVAPRHRGRGVGTALFRSAEARARELGATELKVETQDINVPACRLYAREGCVLRVVRLAAYPELPHETQLLWNKPLR